MWSKAVCFCCGISLPAAAVKSYLSEILVMINLHLIKATKSQILLYEERFFVRYFSSYVASKFCINFNTTKPAIRCKPNLDTRDGHGWHFCVAPNSFVMAAFEVLILIFLCFNYITTKTPRSNKIRWPKVKLSQPNINWFCCNVGEMVSSVKSVAVTFARSMADTFPT